VAIAKSKSNEKGEVVGWHEGALAYTIGQRHGFHLNNKSSEEEKMYVVSKNIEKNTI
jgi:tRNA U34 2-thiouridine synthase MnmA/TrmU